MKKRLLALSFDETQSFMLGLGFKKYRVKQVLGWIYQRYVGTIDEMSDLSKQDRIALSEQADLQHLKIVRRQRSEDQTEKFLLGLEDGNQIESVLIPEEKRLTLCISTQAGCTLDCTFCRTAQEKLKRNLRSDEIINQALTVQKEYPDRKITNIVLMGMGEPLANLAAVTEAVQKMTAPLGLNISPRRVTVSTAGMVPQISEFLMGPTRANLSVSLNATTNEVRDQIMPKVNRLYPIDTLLAAIRKLPLPPRRRVTFEYVMLAGVNDSLADARRLIRILHGIRCKVNLIPFNEFSESPYRRPTDKQIALFQDTLRQAEVTTTLRKSRGRDILAACGQLVGTPSSSPPLLKGGIV
jgi:23S rRNA (adenine2503-C2)-methyltransferase